ncbi:MAG: MMPL family transporter, partial [Dehalococcoidia bacterium]
HNVHSPSLSRGAPFPHSESITSTWRLRADAQFAGLGHLVVRRPRLIIAASLLPVLLLASQLRFLQFETSTESFLRVDDPTLATYNAFRDQFGRDELIILALQPPKIFDLEFLETLRRLHDRIEADVPYLEEVTSLINARATRGREGELLVDDLLEEWPESEADLRAVESFVANNPTYRNLLMSEDGRTTTLVIQTSRYSSQGDPDDLTAGFEEEEDASAEVGRAYLTDEENTEVVQAVSAIVDEFRQAGLQVAMAGSPVVTHKLKANMRRDMMGFIRFTILAIAVLLFVLFRRMSAVALPLVVVICSLLATLGLMAATGTSFKLPVMVLPSFLLAVGVGYSVHILALFYRSLAAGESREASIVGALEHSGLPVVLTSLTTAGGLSSFATAELAPIADLGTFAPAGILIALLLSVTLLPAMLAVVPVRARPAKTEEETALRHLLDRMLAAAGNLACGRPGWVIGVSAVILVIAAAGVTRLRFAHEPLKWLPESEPARQATELIDREMKGSITVEVLLDRKDENAWYEPEPLKKLDALAKRAEQYRDGDVFIGRAFSLVDVLKEIHKALNENASHEYRVPADRKLIAQEFLLFENSGSDDLEDVVDSRFSKVRLTLKAPFIDAVAYANTLPALQETIEASLGNDTEVTLTGLMPMLFGTMKAVMVTMTRSYVLAFIIITTLMAVLLGSVRLGLLSMVPNLLPILMALGLMGFLGWPLDVFTLLVGSIALGLAVDDTIHFMHNYLKYLRETGDSQQAVQQTLQTAGRAMLLTSLVLCTGFLIFTLSKMSNISHFGALTAFAIAMALAADFLLAPALMHLIHRKRG